MTTHILNTPRSANEAVEFISERLSQIHAALAILTIGGIGHFDDLPDIQRINYLQGIIEAVAWCESTCAALHDNLPAAG